MLQKDRKTEQFRHQIEAMVESAAETNDAEALLNALSYQSMLCSGRHVWIELDLDGIKIDLEDWDIEEEWDNTVASITAESESQAIEIVRAWLTGVPLVELSGKGVQFHIAVY